jgi:dTDP-4-amino-4,6-dideoxygalactose transaminase
MSTPRARPLAMFGGPPAFPVRLCVGTPNIGDRRRFLERVAGTLDRKVLTNDGPLVRELEQKVAEAVGVRHCAAMRSATTGLQVAVRAMGLSGEVIVPSFAFIATAHVLRWQGITPVFADVDGSTHNLDPAAVERRISPLTTGILGVHLWGRPCEVDALEDIARRHGLKLLFDAAHAFGCTRAGRMVGRFGAAEVFSFHATKFINSLEGGAVVTNDDELAREVRLMRNFGFEDYDRVACVGINGKMDEVSAAMGLTSLESVDEFLAANRRNFDAYARGLASIPGIRLLPYDEGELCNRQYVVLEVDEQAAGIDRDTLMHLLRGENVLARRYFYPGCHRMEPYRSSCLDEGEWLPETERLAGRVLQLPTGTAVGPAEIAIVCEIIRTAVAHGPGIRRHPRADPWILDPAGISAYRHGPITDCKHICTDEYNIKIQRA